MKRIYFIFTATLLSITAIAQEPADALRYSWYTSSGTARQQAIGGAMGSLGGDIGAVFVNPAGLGFYKTGDLVISPAFFSLNNKATYYGRTEKNEKSNLAFGTSGLVMGGNNYNSNKKGRISSAFSLAVNQTANFGSNLLYRGFNNQNSYSQKFLDEIRNNNDKDANHVATAYPFGSSLAFNTYWIDTVAGGSAGNYQFQSRVPGGGLLQENSIVSRGGITELAIAGAMNLRDKLFLGGTIGIPFLHYTRASTFTEADPSSNANNKFDFGSITENLTTDGAGVNIKAGIIYEPMPHLRLGFAVHSPTYYSLTDKYSASVTANTENYKGLLTQSSSVLTNGQDASFKYTLLTPYRLIASGSYVINEVKNIKKQKGFITADIEYINYKASSFKTDPDNNDQDTKNYLKSLNKAIDNSYKGAFNFKVGGELKFTTVMARLGFAYYGNPYQNLNGANGSKLLFSGGLGYRNKGMFIDVGYVYTAGKDVHFPYRLQSVSFSGANVKSSGGNAIVTIGFKI